MNNIKNFFMVFLIFIIGSYAHAQTIQNEHYFQWFESKVISFVQSEGHKSDVRELLSTLNPNAQNRYFARIANMNPQSKAYETEVESIFKRVMMVYKAMREIQIKSLLDMRKRGDFLIAVENSKNFGLSINNLKSKLSASKLIGKILLYNAIVSGVILVLFDGIVALACITPAVIGVFYFAPVILAVNVYLGLNIGAYYIYENTEYGHQLKRNIDNFYNSLSNEDRAKVQRQVMP